MFEYQDTRQWWLIEEAGKDKDHGRHLFIYLLVKYIYIYIYIYILKIINSIFKINRN